MPLARCHWVLSAAVWLLFQFIAANAWGHATQLSASRVELSGPDVRVEIEANGADLAAALRMPLLGPDRSLDAAALARAAPRVGEYLLAHSVIEVSSGGRCQGRLVSLDGKGEHAIAVLDWRCPPGRGSLRYRVNLFHEIDAASRHMVVVRGAAARVALLSASVPTMELAQRDASALDFLRHYLVAGIEHILIGYDHLAFLLAVLVWARGIWPLVKVVSAFTVAHSITLGLAATEVVMLPSAWVELGIALSIVYVAAENFVVRDLRHRAWLTFTFGLVHGFGFAAVLRDYGLPRDGLLPALAAFNVGVEAGQLLVVGLVLTAAAPVMRGLKRVKWGERWAARAPFVLSAAVLALGIGWTVERAAAIVRGA